MRVVQAFGRERGWIRRFHETNEAQYDANLETVRISAKYFPFVEFTGVLGIAIVVGVGGLFVDQGIITVGTVLAFVLYLNSLFEPIQQLSQLYNTVQSAGAALHKVFALLDTEGTVGEKPGAIDLPERGAIEVDAVSFAYGGGPPDTAGESHPVGPMVLRDVSLTVQPGERVALVGPTGAGKSTLAKLMVRFYDPARASSASTASTCATRRCAACASASSSCPRKGSSSRARCATTSGSGARRRPTPRSRTPSTRSACRTSSVRSPTGSTPRCASAARGSRPGRSSWSHSRAALADPALLVLDEATSNLDPGTERLVERARDADRGPHRGRRRAPALDRARCDRIAVVDDGRLMEVGTHDELLERRGRYSRLFAAWDSGQPMDRSA